MVSKLLKSVPIVCIVLVVLTNIGLAISAKEIIKKVQKKFDSIDNLSADLKEIFHWQLADQTETFEGRIYLQKQDKFRLESKDEIIISDGETLWRYSAVNNQVIIENLQKTGEALLPRDLLFRYARDYRAQLVGREKTDKGRFYVLALFPKGEDEFITRMEVWVDESNWLTKRVEYVDINQNKTIYEISDIVTDVELEEGLFKFEIPKGVEVVDMR